MSDTKSIRIKYIDWKSPFEIKLKKHVNHNHQNDNVAVIVGRNGSRKTLSARLIQLMAKYVSTRNPLQKLELENLMDEVKCEYIEFERDGLLTAQYPDGRVGNWRYDIEIEEPVEEVVWNSRIKSKLKIKLIKNNGSKLFDYSHSIYVHFNGYYTLEDEDEGGDWEMYDLFKSNIYHEVMILKDDHGFKSLEDDSLDPIKTIISQLLKEQFVERPAMVEMIDLHEIVGEQLDGYEIDFAKDDWLSWTGLSAKKVVKWGQGENNDPYYDYRPHPNHDLSTGDTGFLDEVELIKNIWSRGEIINFSTHRDLDIQYDQEAALRNHQKEQDEFNEWLSESLYAGGFLPPNIESINNSLSYLFSNSNNLHSVYRYTETITENYKRFMQRFLDRGRVALENFWIRDYNKAKSENLRNDVGVYPLSKEEIEEEVGIDMEVILDRLFTDIFLSAMLQKHPIAMIHKWMAHFIDDVSVLTIPLSSGQKHLFSLGHKLSQSSTSDIIIIDEPEISLHIDWQSKFINGLKSILPDHSFILMTHSPEIVIGHEDLIIELPPGEE